jgi:hypothetical protein
MLFTVSVVSSVHPQSPAAAKLKSDGAAASVVVTISNESIIFCIAGR